MIRIGVLGVVMAVAGLGASGRGACPTCAGGMQAARATHTATRLADGRVLVVGGMQRNREYLRSAEIYDPRTRAFRAAAEMPGPRGGHTATLLHDGRVLIAGGYDGSEHTLASAVLYDPARDVFDDVSPMHVARGEHTATLLPDGRVVIAGGEDRGVATASIEVFDPATGRFSQAGSMTIGREGHVAALLPDGLVLLAGGDPDLHTVLASAEVFDPASGTSRSVGSLGVARHKAAAVTTASGSVLVIGGSDGRDFGGRIAEVERFDPRSGTFHAAGELTEGRFKIDRSTVGLTDGGVIVSGGAPGVARYDPATGQSAVVAGGPGDARYYGTATELADGDVLITGGYDDRTFEGTARVWLIRAASSRVVERGAGR